MLLLDLLRGVAKNSRKKGHNSEFYVTLGVAIFVFLPECH